MTLLAPLLALFSCKSSPEERKATEAFPLQSLFTYEYCGEKDGFQYFLLGNSWERTLFKVKSSEIHINSQYAFRAGHSFEPKTPITPVEQERVFAEIPTNGQNSICIRTILYNVISLAVLTYTNRLQTTLLISMMK